MINELEVENYIDSHLPQKPHCEHSLKSNNFVFETITDLSNFMKLKFMEHDLKAVKKICYIAEYIYNKGNGTVKTGIENVFIYSLSSIMPTEKEARRELQAIIPVTIFSIYVQQILHSNN